MRFFRNVNKLKIIANNGWQHHILERNFINEQLDERHVTSTISIWRSRSIQSTPITSVLQGNWPNLFILGWHTCAFYKNNPEEKISTLNIHFAYFGSR